ncbi:MAG: NAD(P)/FAD-dependent oxidoreductase [Deltaproteobacteria bacterium]|nr:NAD(P)/FAD-dependent oxidoreductase [Deltaproteobacteria bacterium]
MTKQSVEKEKVIVVGAGPAGLTAAYMLMKKGYTPLVLEADSTYVGGISRTASYKGFNFDIGGHRFFSKAKEVESLWSEILPDDMLERQRKSRIYFNKKFLAYPLKPVDAFLALGPLEAALCAKSYLESKIHPIASPANFEDVIVNSFGRRLFEHFFKTYTEKVWGMPCSEISADWAKQRIKGLSLRAAVLDAFTSPLKKRLTKKKPADTQNVVTTLIDTFRYPRKGPGMLWEAAAEKIAAGGGEIKMGHRVTRLKMSDGGKWNVSTLDADGGKHNFSADYVISSAPLSETIKAVTPVVPDNIVAAANGLRYRDFLTVALVVKDRQLFDDNWIYIQDPGTVVGRIQNFKAWSPEMVPSAELNCYGLEYFCTEGDPLWEEEDAKLIELGTKELISLGLAHEGDIRDGAVVRMPKAYPVYDDAYATHVDTIKSFIHARCPGLFMVGRNGMHRYNNQDHSMVTAMLTVENIVTHSQRYDPWQVNEDAHYIESGKTGDASIYSAPSKKK